MSGSPQERTFGPLGDLVADFRQLPYADDSLDVVVLDPPYMHYGHYINDCKYGNSVSGNIRHPAASAQGHQAAPGERSATPKCPHSLMGTLRGELFNDYGDPYELF
jgi:hypothetical protein